MTPVVERGPVTYVLSDAMRLIGVGGEWDRFALENGSPRLCHPHPLGRPLRSFIADDTTAHLYDALFARVKRTGRAVTFPIRCDGPGVRRDLNLTIEHRADRYLVTSTVLSETQRTALTATGTVERTSAVELLVSCSWCNRVAADNRWMELDDAITRWALFARDASVQISHGVCDPCVARVEALLAPG